MDQDTQYRLEMTRKYREKMEPYFKYIPWFQEKSGKRAYSDYSGEGFSGSSMSFPVYEGTLMNFVNEISKDDILDRNYRYVCNRYHLYSAEDELKAIEKAEFADYEMLIAILSKYVLGGMTKGHMWSEATEKGIFGNTLVKMKEIIEFYDKPIR